MYVIGLHNDEDSGVALIHDGTLVEAVNEERFSRVKLQGGFPKLSLDYVLQKHNLSLGDIDIFAYGWYGKKTDYPDYAKRLTNRIIDAMENDPSCGEIIRQRVVNEFDRDQNTRDLFEAEMDALGVAKEKIFFCDHHRSHTMAAFSCSSFDEAIVFTFDGRGDLKSSTVSIATRDGVEEKDYMLSFESLGFLYGQITYHLGFKPHRHEGKITGLAAFGDAEKTLPLFERLIRWDGSRFQANLGLYKPFYTNLSDALVAELDQHSREDIAAGLQKHCENLVAAYVTYWVEKLADGKPVDICLAGGVCANVRVNQVVAEVPGVRNIFVFPHMGDGGLAVGSACCAYFEQTRQIHVDFPGVYLGYKPSTEEVKYSLEKFADQIEVSDFANDEAFAEAVSDDLIGHKVIGFYEGRMEFGPRALGARSILVHATDRSMNDSLNKRLSRTEFMPFAPVTPVEYAKECYVGYEDVDPCVKTMTRTYDCTTEFQEVHQAVVHVDGTARPQVVNANDNGIYYHVVKKYCDKTGQRAVVNTSFNKHEEPIVRTPQDAIESLLSNAIDVLYLERYKIELKKEA